MRAALMRSRVGKAKGLWWSRMPKASCDMRGVLNVIADRHMHGKARLESFFFTAGPGHSGAGLGLCLGTVGGLELGQVGVHQPVHLRPKRQLLVVRHHSHHEPPPALGLGVGVGGRVGRTAALPACPLLRSHPNTLRAHPPRTPSAHTLRAQSTQNPTWPTCCARRPGTRSAQSGCHSHSAPERCSARMRRRSSPGPHSPRETMEGDTWLYHLAQHWLLEREPTRAAMVSQSTPSSVRRRSSSEPLGQRPASRACSGSNASPPCRAGREFGRVACASARRRGREHGRATRGSRSHAPCTPATPRGLVPPSRRAPPLSLPTRSHTPCALA